MFDKIEFLKTKKLYVVILGIVIVLSPLVVIFAYGELVFGNHPVNPNQSFEILTPKDIWYPQWNYNSFPILISGDAITFYQRPFVITPATLTMSIFIKDVTNPSASYSWVATDSYQVMLPEYTANVSVIPYVNGSYGDNEAYTAGQEYLETWRDSDTTEVNGQKMDTDRYAAGQYYHLCDISLTFVQNLRDTGVHWSVFLELSISSTNGVDQVQNHEMEFLVETTIEYTTYLGGSELVNLGGQYSQPENITVGEGNGATLVMLEGVCSVVGI